MRRVRRTDVTKDEVFKELNRLHLKFGKISEHIFLREATFSIHHVRKLFGKFNLALKEAGYDLNYNNDLRLEDAIQDIKRVGKLLDKTPTWDEYYEYGKYDIDNIRGRFGQWSELLRQAGFIPYCFFTKEEAGRDILRVYQENNNWINTAIYKKQGKHSTSQLYQTFNKNSFEDILKEIGIKSNYTKLHYSDKFLLQELVRFYNENNYVPSLHELKPKIGYPTGRTYLDRFGSYVNAIELAGLTSVSKYIFGLDNHRYQSKEETELANILFKNNIKYVPHKRLCKSKRWMCDFYIPKKKLWIEYDGLGNIRRDPIGFQKKIAFYKNSNKNFVILYKGDNILKYI